MVSGEKGFSSMLDIVFFASFVSIAALVFVSNVPCEQSWKDFSPTLSRSLLITQEISDLSSLGEVSYNFSSPLSQGRRTLELGKTIFELADDLSLLQRTSSVVTKDLKFSLERKMEEFLTIQGGLITRLEK